MSSALSNSVAHSSSLRCRDRKNHALLIARDFGAIKVASAAVRPGRAWKPQRRRFCILGVVQGSPTSGTEIRNRSSSSGSTARRPEYDVVIVGAGIIGLAAAHHILLNTTLSVALIDAVEPCAGATGAGQGYIWMCHRTPGSPGWALASRSKLLWEEFVAELQEAGISPLKAMGWRNTGSLLVASTTEEAKDLQQSVAAALTAGVHAEYMSATEARKAEPALSPDHLIAAAFFPDDSQIDARLTVALLQERIKTFKSSGRYKELFKNPVRYFIRSPTGHIQGVQIEGGEVYCKKAVVVATGAWSSTMMLAATAEWGLSVVPPVKPRKGHLLVLHGMKNVQLRRGIMEYKYLSHSQPSHADVVARSDQGDATESSSLELAMTATLDQNGNLLLGSSREFVGFDTDVHTQVVESIVKRARKFLWGLSHLSVEHVLQSGRVRTGLRPFVPDGRPLIGAIEDVPGLIFATGHEGSGLCLALGTAEMVVNTIQGVESIVDGSFFSPVGRVLPCEKNYSS